MTVRTIYIYILIYLYEYTYIINFTIVLFKLSIVVELNFADRNRDNLKHYVIFLELKKAGKEHKLEQKQRIIVSTYLFVISMANKTIHS